MFLKINGIIILSIAQPSVKLSRALWPASSDKWRYVDLRNMTETHRVSNGQFNPTHQDNASQLTMSISGKQGILSSLGCVYALVTHMVSFRFSRS